MPRYLVPRTFNVAIDEMPVIGRRSKKIAQEQSPQIAWEHSHVTMDDAGVVRTYCVYSSPDEDTLREHALALGEHHVDRILEIAGDVSPADFPSEPRPVP